MKKTIIAILSVFLIFCAVSCNDVVDANLLQAEEPGVTTYTVTFNSNGGSEVTSVMVNAGSKVTKPTDPTQDGYTFGGWYKEEALTTAWNFDADTVTADITLYAKWTVAEIKAICFTANADNSGVWMENGTTVIHLQYSFDGTTWKDFTSEDGKSLSKNIPTEDQQKLGSLNKGDKVYFRAGSQGNDRFYSNTSNYWYFTTSGDLSVSGNIMYLLKANMSDTTKFPEGSTYTFAMLFSVSATGSSGITDASALKLPATTLTEGCYCGMFHQCTSLTKAPDLPATTLDGSCYKAMFQGCTNLTAAPVLPATTLASFCYNSMFTGCTNLQSVTADFGGKLENNGTWTTSDGKTVALYATTSWFDGVSSTGTFNRSNDLEKIAARNESTIPSGWTVNPDWEEEGVKAICFTANEAEAKISMKTQGSSCPNINLQYSINEGDTWQNFVDENETVTSVTLNKVGDKVYIRATNGKTNPFFYEAGNYWSFTTDKQVTLSGNIMYLLDANMSDTTKFPDDSNYNFACLFKGCTGITDASALKLPATTLKKNCYMFMFEGCTGLTKAPQLPEATLADECYAFMFNGCTNLKIEESSGASTQGGTKIFSCTDGTKASGMFNNTKEHTGAFNPTAGNTYYWYTDN